MNRAAAAIFLALVCWGCPKRIDFGPTGELTDAGQLFELTRAAQMNAVTLQGDAKLRVETPQGSGSVSAFVAASRPGLLRLEMFDFFNRPLAVLVTDGQRFGLYQAQENTFYQGPATPRTLATLLPLALPSEELVRVMLGQVPFIPSERMRLSLDRSEGLYVLTLQQGEVTQVLHIHPTHLRVVRSQVRGVPAYDLEYGSFKEQGGVLLAHEVTLSVGQAETRVRLRYTDVSVNGAPDLTLFDLSPPEGIAVVELDAEGRELPPPVVLPPPPPGS